MSIDYSMVLMRLKRLERQFLASSAQKENVSYIFTNDINGIRKDLITNGSDEISSYVKKNTSPLTTSRGNPPYPSKPDAAVHLAQILQDTVKGFNPVNKSIEPTLSLATTPKVFIVHGHDELNLLRLKNLITDRFKVSPVILSEQVSEGRTIIEKFERIASGVPFCIALLTPDDEVVKSSGSVVQARPNVVFELGWFYGRLGRSRVCIICKKGTNIHSDLDGIMRIEFKDRIEEALIELERELKAAGLG